MQFSTLFVLFLAYSLLTDTSSRYPYSRYSLRSHALLSSPSPCPFFFPSLLRRYHPPPTVDPAFPSLSFSACPYPTRDYIVPTRLRSSTHSCPHSQTGVCILCADPPHAAPALPHPASAATPHAPHSAPFVCLSENNLGMDGGAAVAGALRWLTALQSLDLR
jgi:hypothetical protein